VTQPLAPKQFTWIFVATGDLPIFLAHKKGLY